MQMRRHLESVDDSGPSTYKLLLRLLMTHFDVGDQRLPFKIWFTFGLLESLSR